METTRIERFTSRTDAELASSMLIAHGFNARVTADDVAGIHPDIPFGIGGTAVVVPREQYADAVALLDARFEGSLDEATAVTDGSVEDAPADEATGRDQHRRGRRRVSMAFALAMAVLLATILTTSAGVTLNWW